MAGLNPKYVLKNPPVAQAPITPIPSIPGAIKPQGGMAAGQGGPMAYMGFDKLAAKTSPAIAATVGRKKYGKAKFQKAAASGKKMKGMKPKTGGMSVK